MNTSNPLPKLLEKKNFIVIDGALATELESRGSDLRHQLWSAKILLEEPQSIYRVHLDYFNAGADIAITSSYQASVAGLKGMQVDGRTLSTDDALAVIRRSVTVAQEARAHANARQPRELLIAGSVGPYGAYLANGSEYRGDYFLPEDQMKDFHRPRIQALVDAGADLLACETLPSVQEIKALLNLLCEFPSTVAWFSFTTRDHETLSDGTPLEDVCELVNTPQVIAVGVNCVPLEGVSATLQHLSKFTSKPLLAYPNSGEKWDNKSHQWYGHGMKTNKLSDLVEEWHKNGATLVGGCCRTSPEHTQIISGMCKLN